MDESTDRSDTAQVAIFIRGVDENFQIAEELAALYPLKSTTKSVDLFTAFQETLSRFSLTFKNLSGLATDGAPAMTGKLKGLSKLINDCAIESGNMKMK